MVDVQFAHVMPVIARSREARGTSYPAERTRSTNSSSRTTAGSKVTSARSDAKLTPASVTPSAFPSTRSIVAAQFAQVIPVTGSDTVRSLT